MRVQIVPPYSCPLTAQTAHRTSGSGSWRAIARPSTGHTGKHATLKPFDPIMLVFTVNKHLIIHCSHSTQSTRKLYGSESARTHTWGGAGISGHLRTHQPAHPFIQDPAMPPLPPPNTLAQLEEACRRLEEVSKPPKQRCGPFLTNLFSIVFLGLTEGIIMHVPYTNDHFLLSGIQRQAFKETRAMQCLSRLELLLSRARLFKQSSK